MNYYTRIYKYPDSTKLIGIMAIDDRGNLCYVGTKQLVKPLDAFFAQHKTLWIQQKRNGMYLKKPIEPGDNPESWLIEFSRQMPSPYYGLNIQTFNGFIEQIKQVYQQLEGTNEDPIERRY